MREAKVSVEQQQVKSKSFADMVRLQRPAVTRKWQDVNKQRQQSSALAAERQMTLSSGQKTWTVQDPNLVNGKPKEYGKIVNHDSWIYDAQLLYIGSARCQINGLLVVNVCDRGLTLQQDYNDIASSHGI